MFSSPLPDSLSVETKGELVSSGAAPGCAVSDGLGASLQEPTVSLFIGLPSNAFDPPPDPVSAVRTEFKALL